MGSEGENAVLNTALPRSVIFSRGLGFAPSSTTAVWPPDESHHGHGRGRARGGSARGEGGRRWGKGGGREGVLFSIR